MKNLFFLGLISFAFLSCSKESEQELISQPTSIQSEPLAAMAPNKEPDFNADLDSELCVPGSGNCAGVDIVGGAPTEFIDLKDNIDDNTVTSYLNTSNIAVLSQGDSRVSKYYTDVMNGTRSVSYTDLVNASGTVFLFDACSNCSETERLGQVIREN